MTSNILKRSRAANAWGSSAGMKIIWPGPRMKGSPAIVISPAIQDGDHGIVRRCVFAQRFARIEGEEGDSPRFFVVK